MKILDINLKKGIVKVIPEYADDFWHLYNVIYEGDQVYAFTTREKKPDEKFARPGRGERVSVFLGVKAQTVAWDRLLGKLRIHGIICEAPEIVPTGAYHTISISAHQPLTIVKDHWASHELDRLKRASRTSEKPIVIVSIDDEGYAVATTAQYGVDVRIEETVKLPGKLEAEKRGDAVKGYFKKTTDSLRKVWMENRSPIVIVGVGFVKNDYAKYLRNEASDVAQSVIDVKSVNNGGSAGIHEALRSGVLLKTLKQLRVAEESEVIEEILKRLGKGESNVTYGLKEVERAAKMGAVEKLAVADTTLRESDDKTRLSLEDIMREAERKRGEVMVISTEHEAGAKLISLGGVAATLRFGI